MSDTSKDNMASNRSVSVLRLPPLTAIASKLPKLSFGRELEMVASAMDGRMSSMVGMALCVGWDVGEFDTG